MDSSREDLVCRLARRRPWHDSLGILLGISSTARSVWVGALTAALTLMPPLLRVQDPPTSNLNRRHQSRFPLHCRPARPSPVNPEVCRHRIPGPGTISSHLLALGFSQIQNHLSPPQAQIDHLTSPLHFHRLDRSFFAFLILLSPVARDRHSPTATQKRGRQPQPPPSQANVT